MNAFADWLIHVIESVPAWAVYLIAGGAVYAETALLLAGLIMPSEALLLAAGVAAAVGQTNIVALIVIACICAIAGDVTGYWLGRLGGPRLRGSALGRRFGEQRWDRAQQRIDTSGIVVVTTGRWIGYVRSIVPRVAGMTQMRFARFGAADVVGAVSWVTTVLLVGFFAGAVLGATILVYAVLVVVSLVAVLLAGKWAMARWHHRAGPVIEEPLGPVIEEPLGSAGGLVGGVGGGFPGVAGGHPGADDELDLVEDHQRQHDQTDHRAAEQDRRHR